MALNEAVEEAFKKFKQGILSSKAFKQQFSKYVIRISGKRDYSKWTMDELRAIRSRNGVGRPPAIIKARKEAKENNNG